MRKIYSIAIFAMLFSNLANASIITSGDVNPTDPTIWKYLTTFCYIAESSNGAITVSDGGLIYSRMAYLGYEADANGEVTITGQDTAWNNRYYMYVGYNGNGTLSITDGGVVSSSYNWLGYENRATGTATVSGVGSVWENRFSLCVGCYGNGELNIINGGEVTVDNYLWVSRYAGSSGLINFDNGTLNTQSLFAGINELTGTGTINTNGFIFDKDVIFSQTEDLNQTIVFNENENQDISINLNIDGTGDMGVGYSTEGFMTISNGVKVSSDFGYVGYKTGSDGTVVVDGENSTWNNAENLYIGYEGTGEMTVIGGGSVSSNFSYIGYQSGSAGLVVIDGQGSIWESSNNMYVGCGGSGELLITNGGTVNCEGSCSIGGDAGLTGNVTVYGESSKLNTSDTLYVGGYSDASLEIINGGSVSNYRCYIGYFSGSNSSVTVDGYGSIWENGEILSVGKDGSGTLCITNGGKVSSYQGRLGDYSGSIGTANVSGIGSQWDSFSTQTFFVGLRGTGILNISDVGLVSNYSAQIANASNSAGTVTVSGLGSTWSNIGNLAVGYNGSGILSITNGGLVSIGKTLTIDYNCDNDSSINMMNGGMLAIYSNVDDSLQSFLNIIAGTDAINYYNEDTLCWENISGATYGEDYTLMYIDDTTDDLYGYTVLTVGVPEPMTIAIFSLGGLLIRRKR